MSENRATKSGMSRDVQQKIASKYDQASAAEAMAWVARSTKESLDTSGDIDSVYDQLKDGYILCKLINEISPGCMPAAKLSKRATLPFKQMELIEMFTQKVKSQTGIPDYSVFAVPDLYEKQNLTQVITCLQALGSKCLNLGGPVQGYGPKESEGNRRQFTEEQLAQGKNIIGLQMGSNKGASQAGQNFGKARHIVD